MKKSLSLILVCAFLALGVLAGCSSGGVSGKNRASDTVDAYVACLGVHEEDFKLPSDLASEKGNVLFLGQEGTVTYQIRKVDDVTTSDVGVVDQLTWTMNATVESDEDFEKYVKAANDYFGCEAEELTNKSFYSYSWKDRETGCYVYADCDYGEISFEWRY